MNLIAKKFQVPKVKSKSIDSSPIPYWIKERVGEFFIMRFLNDAYEEAYLKPNGLNRGQYVGTFDSLIWSKEISDEFHKHDLECYEKKGWIEFMETIHLDGKMVRRKFIKQYVKDNASGTEYIIGMSVDFFD